MADAYKGLTIRIGGETTGLQKALQAVNSAASQTQKQLSRLKQAAKMDPGNMGILDEQIELVGQRAVEASARLNQLRSALKDVSSQKLDNLYGKGTTKTIGELAAETKNAAVRAAEAKQNYNAINTELAKLYAPINKAARATDEFGKQWEDLHDGKKFTMSDLIDEQGIDAAISKMREITTITDEEEQAIRQLRSQWEGAFNENEIAKAVAGMKDLENEITRSAAQAKSFATEFTNLTRIKFSNQFGEGIDDQLTRINMAAQRTEETMRRMKSAFDVDPSNVGAATEYMRSLSDSTELAQQRADLLRQKLARMDAAGIGDLADDTRDVALEAENAAAKYEEVTTELLRMQGILETLNSRKSTMDLLGETDTDEYQKLNSEITQVTAKVDQLTVAQNEAERAFNSAVSVDEYRKTQAAVAEAEAQVEKYNNQLKETTNAKINTGAFTTLGLTLSTTVTPALVQVGRAAIDSANTFDSAYRDMRKTVDGTEQQFEDLRQSAIDFSMTHVTSADQIMSIQAIGGELGVATEDLKTFAETVSNIDVATNLNVEDAATSLGQLSNIMKDLTSDKYPAFSDALVRLGNNGASTETQIADIATRIGSMGSILGFTTPEILAWASTIASTGQNAEAAGTAVSNTMAAIEKAVSKGGDSMEAFAQVSQMSAEDFMNTWREDPSLVMENFIKGLNKIEEDGGSATGTLDALGITASRQVQAIEGLMQTVGLLDDNLQMSNDAWNGVSDKWGKAGDAAREADAKAEGFSGSLSRMQNVAQNTAATIGSAVEPAFKILADVLSEVGTWFNELPTGMQQLIVALGGITAAIGPLTLLVNGVGEFVGKIKEANGPVKTLMTAMERMGTKGSTLGKIFSTIGTSLGGIGFTVAAVGALAFADAAMEAQEKAENFEKATSGLEEAVKNSTGQLATGTRDMGDFGASAEETAANVDELIERQAALSDRIKDTNDSAGDQIYQLGQAQSVIDEYMNKTGLSTEEQGRLRAAIELVNEVCGTEYSVIDAVNGKIADQEGVVQDTTAAIDDYIRKAQQMARVDALQSNLSDALEGQQDAAETYAKAKKEYEDAVRSMQEEWGSNPDTTAMDSATLSRYQAAQREVGELRKSLGEAKNASDSADDSVERLSEDLGVAAAAADGTADAITSFVANSVDLDAGLSASGQTMGDFVTACQMAGVSVEDLQKLTADQLMSLGSNFDGTVGSVVKSLNDMGVGAAWAGQAMRTALEGLGTDAQVALEGVGINMDQLAQKLTDAGVHTDLLNQIGSANFAALVQNCGGSIDQLVWMIQNYNAQPIVDKDGNITVNQAELRDAQGNLYIWNGTTLVSKDGSVYVAQGSLTDAQNNVYTWNGTQLLDKDGNAVVDYVELTDGNGQAMTWNGTELKTLDGHTVIDEVQLTDCLGNTVTWNGTTLKPLNGHVYCTYDELTAALSSLRTLSSYDGYTVTAHVNTVRTTTNRTINETINGGGASIANGGTGRSRMAAPMSLAASRARAVMPLADGGDTTHAVVSSAVPSQQYAAMARSIASNPTVLSKAASNIASSVLSTSKSATTRNSGAGKIDGDGDGSYNGTSGSSRALVREIAGLRNDIKSGAAISNSEVALYVDGKKLASTIAQPMDRRLNVLSKRRKLG